jgi:hypothetical protein
MMSPLYTSNACGRFAGGRSDAMSESSDSSRVRLREDRGGDSAGAIVDPPSLSPSASVASSLLAVLPDYGHNG